MFQLNYECFNKYFSCTLDFFGYKVFGQIDPKIQGLWTNVSEQGITSDGEIDDLDPLDESEIYITSDSMHSVQYPCGQVGWSSSIITRNDSIIELYTTESGNIREFFLYVYEVTENELKLTYEEDGVTHAYVFKSMSFDHTVLQKILDEEVSASCISKQWTYSTRVNSFKKCSGENYEVLDTIDLTISENFEIFSNYLTYTFEGKDYKFEVTAFSQGKSNYWLSLKPLDSCKIGLLVYKSNV
ncbi:MAG: hypothetical protein MK078_14175 [Crocinitomicaceae bacterium]|nr:hypothetical protein [Crocinitomicaceae bacterium]